MILCTRAMTRVQLMEVIFEIKKVRNVLPQIQGGFMIGEELTNFHQEYLALLWDNGHAMIEQAHFLGSIHRCLAKSTQRMMKVSSVGANLSVSRPLRSTVIGAEIFRTVVAGANELFGMRHRFGILTVRMVVVEGLEPADWVPGGYYELGFGEVIAPMVQTFLSRYFLGTFQSSLDSMAVFSESHSTVVADLVVVHGCQLRRSVSAQRTDLAVVHIRIMTASEPMH
mmetsp:Transcript_18579/g.53345  ORF Transcript_18579/g.53345 Transcript_18579/m.53345 type:complete len:226 (+) Transcript_18579:1374-2051(+)